MAGHGADGGLGKNAEEVEGVKEKKLLFLEPAGMPNRYVILYWRLKKNIR